MWALSALISNLLGGSMKAIGIIILVAGLILGGFALNMDVSVHVPAQDFGYGIRTPEASVANLDKMAQRQNFLIFSGVLAVVGAILTGFASTRSAIAPPDSEPGTATQRSELLAFLDEEPAQTASPNPTSVSICPKCRSMGPDEATNCGGCGAALTSSD
jgi:ribosomal protein L40E